MDQITEDDQTHQELHAAIQNGDTGVVGRMLQEHSKEQYFSYKETSALFKAFSCEQYDIASNLINKGAKIHDDELYDLNRLEIDLTRLNHLLSLYNKRMEKSCIFQLMSWSRSPQGLAGKHQSAIESMYEELFKSEIIRLLMMVLESEAFDIVYDFSSDDVNRVYRLNKSECEAYGLTLTNSKDIFIGAKNLLTVDPQERAKVYGVVAEELCHLALTTLFENDAKPYREEDTRLNQEFWDIVKAVKSSLLHHCHVESVIKDVYTNYEYREWECELIARIPHVIGKYGEILGRRVFLETSELSKLLLFYDKNVVPKCKEFTNPSLNTKSHRMMEQLMKRSECISFTEKQKPPLKEGFKSFRDFLVREEGIYVITTNCTKLCMLHVYHELKCEYLNRLEKKCLFFSWKLFEKEENKILNAFNGKAWEYLVLVLDNKELNLSSLKQDCLYGLDKFKMEGTTVIVITSSQSLGEIFEKKALNYKWENLTDDYQNTHQAITYVFKGGIDTMYVPKKRFPEVFSKEDIMRIVGGEVIELCDGEELYSLGYNQKTYVQRKFKAVTVDRKVFESLPFNASIFLSGLSKWEFQECLINEKSVQWLQGSDDDIRDDKSIFIVDDVKPMPFTDFVEKNPRKKKVWLHHEKGVFYLRKLYLCGDDFIPYLRQVTLSEERMLEFLRTKRIAIICDNAGYGKTTVVSSLIRGVKERKCLSWRIDFKKVSTNEKDPLSIAHITEDSDEDEVFDHLFLMLGVEDNINRLLFKDFSRQGKCFIFFDGFDEVPSKYKNSALKLLSTLKGKANLVVTTRKQHQLELEQLLNTYSYQLVPFSMEDRVKYLGNLWKTEMKFPNGEITNFPKKDHTIITAKIKKIIRELRKEEINLGPEYHDLVSALEKIDPQKSLDFLRSEIDSLDFSKLAKNIVNKKLLDKEKLEFMGIPLHLYMMGIIHFIGNFNVEIQSDIYSLYSDFIEKKILIYLEEKQEMKEGLLKEKNQVKLRNHAYRIQNKLADQFMNEENIYLESKMDKENLELCSALGLVFIHDGEVRFVHQTFAEFFKAESLRQNIKKEVFIDVLMEKRFSLVRRFLSSALKKKNFENLSEEFFRDVHFLLNVMRKLMDLDPVLRKHESDSEGFCLFKIVKRLLETFEGVKKELVNEFVEGLHGLVMEKLGKSSCLYPMRIGGCLPVLMIKDLINKNFMVNSVIILNYVRFSENPEEVMDILEECISLKSVSEIGFGQIENRKKEKRNSECLGLLDLLRLKDSDGNGLLYHALWNSKTESFAHLLKFPRDVLGKDQFINAIVQSYEYKSQMKKFMKHERLGIICTLFKDLSSVFGNEIETLFDTDLKMLFINRAATAEETDESGSPFEKATRLFQECFGMEELKEMFLSRYCQHDNLIHQLIFSLSDGTFMKILKEIENILCKKMKQFLKITDRHFRNILHFAALKGDVYFHDLLQLFSVHFDKKEMREILLTADFVGNNAVHLLVLKNSSDMLMKNFGVIKKVLGNAEWFKKILKSKGESSKNIFHLASIENILLEDLVQFCNEHLDKEKIKKMLVSSMKSGDNVIHLLVLHNSPERLKKNLQLLKETWGNEKWFKDFLISKGQNSVNVFHLAAFRDMSIHDLLQFYNTYLKKDEMYQMLCSNNDSGDNMIHLLIAKNSSDMLIKNLNLIKGFFADAERFQLLLNSTGQNSLNILHIAAHRNMHLAQLLQFCSANLLKDGFKKLLIGADLHGNHVLHRLVLMNSSEMLIENMKLIQKEVGDDSWFGELLKIRGKHSVNILYLASTDNKHLRGLLQLCNGLLGKEETQRMLFDADGEVDALLSFLFVKNSPEILQNNLKAMMESLGNDWFREFLKKKCSNNLLHFAACGDMSLCNLLPFLCTHIEEADIKELFLSCDADGYNVIHLLVLKNSSERLKENLEVIKGILGKYQWFKDLFQNTSQDSVNILQITACRDACLDEILHFLCEHFQQNEIKDMFLSRDAKGDNLIHYLVLQNSSEILMKNLNAIRNISRDDVWFTELLKTKGQSFKNLFHLVCEQDIYLDDLLGFCNQLLSKDELKEMLFDGDADEYNVMHCLILKNSSEKLMKNLNVIRYVLGNVEWFKEILRSRGRTSLTIIHLATFKDMYLGNLLQFLRCDLDIHEMEELLLSTDAEGDNVLHFIVLTNSPEIFTKNLSLLMEFLGDDKFEKLLKSRGRYSQTIFHISSTECKLLHEIMQFCKVHLNDSDFKEMIFSTNELGDGMIHTLALQNSSESFLNHLKFIREILGDEESFTELLISKGEHSYNILQLASHTDSCLADLLQFCCNHLEQEVVKEMILSYNDYGDGLIHLLVLNNSIETLVKNLVLLKEILGDKDFQGIVETESRNSVNVLHLASTRNEHLDPLLHFFGAYLGRNKMKDLLLSPTLNGENIINLLVINNSSETLMNNLKMMREILGDEEWFRQALLSEGATLKKMFQLSSMNDVYFGDLLQHCVDNLDKEEIKEILVSNKCDVTDLSHGKNSFQVFISNLMLIVKIVGDESWFEGFIRSKFDYFKNMCHLASVEDLYLGELLCFCNAHLEKEEVKEMLVEADGCSVIHCLFSNNSSEVLTKNMMVIKEILGDECFKDVLKGKDQNSVNLLHSAADRDINLADLLQIFCDNLESHEIRTMLSSTDKIGNNVIHQLVLNNSTELLMKNLKLIERALGDEGWFKELLESIGQNSVNAIQLAVFRNHLADLLQFYDAHFNKRELKEMLLNADQWGEIVTHHVVLNNGPKMLMKNLESIAEVLGSEEWIRELLRVKARGCVNIPYLAASRDLDLNDLLKYMSHYFKKHELKEILLSTDPYGLCIIHRLPLSNSIEMLIKNLLHIEDIIGEKDWFEELLNRKCHSGMNILHYAAGKDNYLTKLLTFLEARFEKDKIKKILFGVDAHGNTVIHYLVSKNSTKESKEALLLIKDIASNEFKQFLSSKTQNGQNVLHLAAFKDMHLEDLIRFIYSILEIDEIRELILSRDKLGDNVMHLLAWNNSPKTLVSNLELLKEILGEERFKELLKSKDQNSLNVIHIATTEDNHLCDLLLFLKDNLDKDEIREMFFSSDTDNNNVMHYLVMRNSSQILMKNLNLIRDILGNGALFKQLLKSRARNHCNVFHIASIRDNYLGELLRFCSDHLEKHELKEMLLWSDELGDNPFHLLLRQNSCETLMKNIGVVKETLDNDEWFKQILKSKGQFLRSVFHFATLQNTCLEDLLRYFNAHLERDELKEFLLSPDRDNCGMIHLMLWQNSSETLINNLRLIQEVLEDSEWFKNFLLSKGLLSRNVFHYIAYNKNEKDFSFLRWCFSESEIADLMTERDENGYTCLHCTADYPVNIPVLLNYAHKVLRFEISRFHDLVLAEDIHGNTFLHNLEENFDIDSGTDIFHALRDELSDEVYNRLLRVRNKQGQTFLQVEKKIQVEMIKCCAKVLEKDLFEELLQMII